MTDREKLYALMKEAVRNCDPGNTCLKCHYRTRTDCMERVTADYLIANGVVVRSSKPMRVEVTTDDFRDLESARAKGYYRKHYFCPSCDIEIGNQTFDSKRKFGQGTVLHSNRFPNCCPSCGERLSLEDNDGRNLQNE